MENNAQLIAQCEARAKEWLSPAFDEETRKEVLRVDCVASWVPVPTV